MVLRRAAGKRLSVGACEFTELFPKMGAGIENVNSKSVVRLLDGLFIDFAASNKKGKEAIVSLPFGFQCRNGYDLIFAFSKL